MKKFLAIILTLAMLISASCMAFAADNQAAVTDSDETVATVSLCSNIYVWPISGHTWIYVHNNSDEPIQVGHYTVQPDQGMSVGAFSFSVNDGWGLYYNMESYKENEKNRAHNVRSISEGINAEELKTLNQTLINYPNYWGFVNNCATFSFTIWNSISGDHYFSLLIPAISDFMILCGGGKKGTLKMYQQPRDQVFRQVGFGENAHLEPVSDYSAS